MMVHELIWEPIIATLALILVSAVLYGVLLAVRRIAGSNPTSGKTSTYTGGEILLPEEMHADSEQFFSPVRRVLSPFYRHVREAHTGALNTYLLWAIVGLVFIMIVVFLTVR